MRPDSRWKPFSFVVKFELDVFGLGRHFVTHDAGTKDDLEVCAMEPDDLSRLVSPPKLLRLCEVPNWLGRRPFILRRARYQRRKNKISTRTRAMPANPPTIPPTIWLCCGVSGANPDVVLGVGDGDEVAADPPVDPDVDPAPTPAPVLIPVLAARVPGLEEMDVAISGDSVELISSPKV